MSFRRDLRLALARIYFALFALSRMFCMRLCLVSAKRSSYHRCLVIHCSVTQLCPTLWDPIKGNRPGFPVLHHLPEITEIHVHLVGDDIQPSCPVIPFCSCLQSFPASGSFLMSQLFPSGGQSIGASASASVPPMNIQD